MIQIAVMRCVEKGLREGYLRGRMVFNIIGRPIVARLASIAALRCGFAFANSLRALGHRPGLLAGHCA